jgi:threonine/homoserine/homoserine lactone efflux protein
LRELAIAFSLGVAFSAPPGIVTAEAIRRGIAGGFVSATMVGIGSLIGDAAYAAMALGGLTAVSRYTSARLIVGSAGVLLLFWLALEALRAKAPAPGVSLNRAGPRSDFLVGAGLSLANPWAIAFWLGFGGVLLSAGIRNPQANLPLLLAMFLIGALVWSLLLSLMIALARRFVNAVLFRVVSICSALVFTGTALYTIWQLYLDLRRG